MRLAGIVCLALVLVADAVDTSENESALARASELMRYSAHAACDGNGAQALVTFTRLTEEAFEHVSEVIDTLYDDLGGRSALICAGVRQLRDLGEMLLMFGADANLMDHSGNTYGDYMAQHAVERIRPVVQETVPVTVSPPARSNTPEIILREAEGELLAELIPQDCTFCSGPLSEGRRKKDIIDSEIIDFTEGSPNAAKPRFSLGCMKAIRSIFKSSSSRHQSSLEPVSNVDLPGSNVYEDDEDVVVHLAGSHKSYDDIPTASRLDEEEYEEVVIDLTGPHPLEEIPEECSKEDLSTVVFDEPVVQVKTGDHSNYYHRNCLHDFETQQQRKNLPVFDPLNVDRILGPIDMN